MASIVFGAGTSHTPMLNMTAEEWPLFEEVDRHRAHLHTGRARRDLRRPAGGRACFGAGRRSRPTSTSGVTARRWRRSIGCATGWQVPSSTR